MSSLPDASPWDARCLECGLRKAIVDHGAHVISFRATGGKIRLETMAVNERHQELLRALERLGIDYEILGTTTSRTNGTRGLTRHQVEVLRTALREGYYDYPRKADLKTLGEILNCSPATVCETLRRAERAILSRTIAEQPLE